MVRGVKDKQPKKAWRFEPPLEEEIKLQKKAMVDYIIDKELESNIPKASIGLYRNILPYMADLD